MRNKYQAATWISVIVFALLPIRQAARAQIVAVGEGSYTTEKPLGERVPSDRQGRVVAPAVTDDVTAPVPTNDWWSSLAYKYEPGDPYSAPMYAHPLVLQADAGGLGLSYPTRPEIRDGGERYVFPYRESVHVGVAGLDAPETKVAGFSDWTVTASWEDESRRQRATFGHGLPFVYLTVHGGDAVVAFAREAQASADVWHLEGNVAAMTVSRTQDAGVTTQEHYAVFGPSGATWQVDDQNGGVTLTSALGGKKYLSIAVLPDDDPATLERFRRHAFAFVTDTRVEWQYDAPTATLTSVFAATTAMQETGDGLVDAPLMALYRHQWMHTQDALTAYRYTSPRGEMRLRDGSAFSTQMTFHGVLPALPDVGSGEKDVLYDYVQAALDEGDLLPRGGVEEAYWVGKAMMRLVNLIDAATVAGHNTARALFTALLKSRMQDWLGASPGETSELLYYDDTWHTLLSYPTSFGADVEMNDHHFHYGYFVHAAAALARYDPGWGDTEAWGGMVDVLAKDVANGDRTDDRFPFLRTFDPYAGHSWASGHAYFLDGNNQESSSEALQLAGGLILWGAVTGDADLRDLGIFLYTTEVAAVDQYWFDVDDAVFPPGYTPPTAGIVWGSGADYGTWFDANPVFVHGINYLPITGLSLYLGFHPDYVDRNVGYLTGRVGEPVGPWKDIVWSYLATAHADRAVAQFNLYDDYTPEYGESKAHTYQWLHFLDAYGRVDTSVTADVATYGVFLKDGTRTYVAYNPGEEIRTVHFSDGVKRDVMPHDFVVASAVGSDPAPVPPPFQLLAGYPNPFTDEARIRFSLDATSRVRLEVFDLLGRRVRVLAEGLQTPGMHEVTLPADALANGTYVCRLTADGHVKTHTMLLMR